MGKFQDIKSKFTPKVRKVLKIVLTLVIIALAGLGFYELRNQFNDINSRIGVLEDTINPTESTGEATQQSTDVEYKVLSRTEGNVRIEKEQSYGPNQAEPPKVYETKKYYIYKLKVTNNRSDAYDFSSSDVKGKTEAGTLINAIDYGIHPDDLKGKKTSVSLAPKGTAEVYVFIPAEEEVIDLYFSTSSF